MVPRSMAAARASDASGSWARSREKRRACGTRAVDQGMGRYQQKDMIRAIFVGPKSWQKLMYLSA